MTTHSYPTGPALPALPKNGFGVTALVLGIVGACVALIPIVGVIAWPMVIVGLIFGLLGIRRAHQGQASNMGSAIAGTVLSGVGLAICILWAAALGATAGQTMAPGPVLAPVQAPALVDVPVPPSVLPSDPGYAETMQRYNSEINRYMCEQGNAYTIQSNQRTC